MNVWVLNQYAVPPDRPGNTRHYFLGKYLASLGWDTSIIASSFDHVLRKELLTDPNEFFRCQVESGIRFLWVKTPPYSGNNRARVWNMISFARRAYRYAVPDLLPFPDAIIGSSPHLFGGFAAERIARKLRVPFILEIRDLWPESLIDLGGYSRNSPVVRMLQLIERYLYRRARSILTLLPYSKDYIIKRGGRAEAIHWLPNGIDLAVVPAPGPFPQGKPIKIFYTGTIGLANGLDTLIDAAKILLGREDSEIEIHIVGDGPALARLRERVQTEGVTNIRLPGPVPRSQVAKVLENASACVITLLGRGLFEYGVSPNKLYDYMGAGRPIIFSVQASRNQVSETGCGVTVPPENPQALAAAIERMAEMPPLERQAMGLRGRRFVEKHHGYSALAEQLAEYLNDARRFGHGLATGQMD